MAIGLNYTETHVVFNGFIADFSSKLNKIFLSARRVVHIGLSNNEYLHSAEKWNSLVAHLGWH